MDLRPLRPSLFERVPPFINFVPALAPGVVPGMEPAAQSLLVYGPQYWDRHEWDQDHLWKIPMAMEKWINWWAEEEAKNRDKFRGRKNHISKHLKRRSMIVSSSSPGLTTIFNPFVEHPSISSSFLEAHPTVKLASFPKMLQIARKDDLGDSISRMRSLYGPEDFDFHPVTFVFPRDARSLRQVLLDGPAEDLWIWKPSNSNNGKGVQVLTSTNIIRRMEEETCGEGSVVCVQKYIRRPLLIDRLKFDIRVYVLLTSVDPLVAYIYDDGLVRIATERYSENPRSLRENCIHVTNFAVNKENVAKFVHNESPNECVGNKWRLKRLWNYLFENYGMGEPEMDMIWSEVEDVVIKTVLSGGYDSMRAEFSQRSKHSRYNCYKLLGFDLLLDADLRVHVLEVNARPQLLDDPVDRAVNRPMICEMFRIVGYHLPVTCFFPYRNQSLGSDDSAIRRLFGNSRRCSSEASSAFSVASEMAFERRVYSKYQTLGDMMKQEKFGEAPLADEGRDGYLDAILEDLVTCDVRLLIKLEEERSVSRHFTRIFPTERTHTFHKYFIGGVPYYDKLLDAYVSRYGRAPEEGIERLRELCKNGVHI